MPDYKVIHREHIIEPPLPARSVIDPEKLEDLAGSMRSVGILQPLIVVPEGDKFKIVAGHRRYLASGIAGIFHLPCMVYPAEGIAEEAAKLHENIFREDISPAEEAQFFQELITKYDCTLQQLCNMVRQKPSYIEGRLDLLKGSQEVFDALEARKITLGVAQQLNRLKDDRLRHLYLHQAVEGGASAEVVRQWVTQAKMDALPLPGPIVIVDRPAGYVPAEQNVYTCVVCSGSADPYNMEFVCVHKWEKEGFIRLMRAAAGVEAKL